jgi:glycopeptide antibiotics resistance protein
VSLDDFRRYLGDVAWFWPGVVISIILSLVLSIPVGRALRVGWPVALTLLVGLGFIAAATLTPSQEALRFGAVGSGTCDLSRIGLAPMADLFPPGDPTFNVLLYIPLGVAIGLFPRSHRKVVLIAAAVVLPIVIETIQLFATGLDRACQSADVSDNLTGLLIGLVLGLCLGVIVRFVRWLFDDDEEPAIDVA